jgi:integrase
VQGLYPDKLDSGLSSATVQKIHTVIHKALTQALKWNKILRNAADAIKAPRSAPEEMHPLSPDEARKLIEAVRGDTLEALYVLAVHTGMRQGELLALKWEDVELNEGVILIHDAHSCAAEGASHSESRRPRGAAAPSTSLARLWKR